MPLLPIILTKFLKSSQQNNYWSYQ